MYHHVVAKLLFLCKRARPDLQTAVAFLCTCVKSPDTDDYKKLGWAIKYLRATRDMTLTLGGSSLQNVQWWVDGSFGVHGDMRSHTGAFMSADGGTIYGVSSKQKLNTKSSTEAELVAVDDVMPQVLWTRYFLQEQGIKPDATVIHQDNQSTMLLENNGRGSSGKKTRHINMRYFFVSDRINKGEITVRYCPTDDMVGDYFTKPLQGTKFRKFRDIILNRTISGPSKGKTYKQALLGPKECVGADAQIVTTDGAKPKKPGNANDVIRRCKSTAGSHHQHQASKHKKNDNKPIIGNKLEIGNKQP